MDAIREVVYKLIVFALQASLIPILAMFIGALFIERVRRILLGIMVVICLLTLFTAYAVVTHADVRYMAFADLWPVLVDSFLKIAPLLVILVFVFAAAVIASPSLIAWMYRMARSQYLARVLVHSEARSTGFVSFDSRAPALQPFTGYRLVMGESGSGKTMLLHRLAAVMAKQAQSNASSPLPVLVEFDRLLAQKFNFEVPPDRLTRLQPISVPLIERMLQREADLRQVCFIIDCSTGTFSLANPYEVRAVLYRLMQFLAPNSFVISLPAGFQLPDFLNQFNEIITLLPLDDGEVVKMLRARGVKGGATGQLRSVGSAWHNLARRPYLLNLLAQSAAETGKVPEDLRELFKKTVYPAKIPTAQVEAGLSRLANEAVQSERYWLPAQQVESIAGARDPKLGSRDLPRACQEKGVLVDLPGPDDAWLTGFGHPLQLAYFTALGWYLSGHLDVKISSLLANPLMVDALVFFNNIDSDAQRFTLQLNAIADQDDPASLHLVVQCLMAMPHEARPAQVIERLCIRVIRSTDFAAGGDSAENIWLVLKTLPVKDRVRLFESALDGMQEDVQVAAVQQLARLSRSADSRSGDLPEILEYGGRSLCFAAVTAWGEAYPDQALDQVCQLYQSGSAGQQLLAVELLGMLPHEAADGFLREALKREKRPEVRQEILRALLSQGGKGLYALLLSIVTDGREADSVRITAAQLLEFSDLPEPPAEIAALRDLVRAARMPIPVAAGAHLNDLLDKLRRRFSDQVSAFESLANPFMINRPVNEPAMFFGRKALMHSLLASIENGGDVLLYGEKRIGKSSVLRQLQIRVSESARAGLPWCCAMIDIEAFDAQEFFYTLMAALLAALDDARLPVEPSYALPYNETAFYHDLMLIIKSMIASKGPGARLVLLLDSADRVLSHPAELLEGFRRVIGSNDLAEHLVVIMAAGRPLTADHPLGGVMAAYPITRFEPAEAIELITTPMEGLVQIEPEAAALVQQFCQGHPYLIQSVCQKLVNQAHASGSDRITAEHARAAALAEIRAAGPRGVLIEQANSLLGNLMDWLEAYPDAPNTSVEEQMKRALVGLREAMIRQVALQRKSKA